MRVSVIRTGAGALSALLIFLLVLPMAVAFAATANKVKNGEEAWFLARKEPLAELPGGDPGCDQPIGCNVSGSAQRPSPHPEGVLVVAANSGDPDAQTFFNFDLFGGLPAGAVITGGKVTMPVAEDPDARNVRPEKAKMVACLVDNDFIPDGTDGGSYKDRPDVNDKVCVDVKQESEEPLTYSIDLERFGKEWSSGVTMSGLTVMVDTKKVTTPNPDETWRVVFNTKRRAEKPPEETKNEFKFLPITSTLEYRVEKAEVINIPTGGGEIGGGEISGGGDISGGNPFPASDPGTSSAPPISGDTGGFDAGTTGDVGAPAPAADAGVIDAPQQAAPPPVDAPVAAQEQAAAEQPVAAPATQPVSAPGLSPAVWILPLLAVAMAGAMAWSLMSPPELIADREGAVSKLMRTRRLQADASTTS